MFGKRGPQNNGFSFKRPGRNPILCGSKSVGHMDVRYSTVTQTTTNMPVYPKEYPPVRRRGKQDLARLLPLWNRHDGDYLYRRIIPSWLSLAVPEIRDHEATLSCRRYQHRLIQTMSTTSATMIRSFLRRYGKHLMVDNNVVFAVTCIASTSIHNSHLYSSTLQHN